MFWNITFIGGGHITRSILGGLLRRYPQKKITVSNRGPEKLALLVSEFGVNAAKTNPLAVEIADVVILAVKPQSIRAVCEETAAVVRNRKPLVILLTAPARLDDISSCFGVGDLGIVRTMTNTATSICLGTTAMFANQCVTLEQKKIAETIFNAVGSAFWVDKEVDLNTFAPLIGCAPAYLFLLVEAMQKAATERGISEVLAEKVSLDVIYGAAELAKQQSSTSSVMELRSRVTTPGGITESALDPLLRGGYFGLFRQAFEAAERRCTEIEETFHQRNG